MAGLRERKLSMTENLPCPIRPCNESRRWPSWGAGRASAAASSRQHGHRCLLGRCCCERESEPPGEQRGAVRRAGAAGGSRPRGVADQCLVLGVCGRADVLPNRRTTKEHVTVTCELTGLSLDGGRWRTSHSAIRQEPSTIVRKRKVRVSTKASFSQPLRAGLSTLMLTGLLSVGATPATAAPAPVLARGGLTSLVDLATERILLADKVAAAKFGTTTPIEDPVREQQVLDKAAALAADAGMDPEETVDFFRAQIEMSKVVQQGLHDLPNWHRPSVPISPLTCVPHWIGSPSSSSMSWPVRRIYATRLRAARPR